MRTLAVTTLIAFASAALAADTYPRQPGITIDRYSFDVVLSDTSSEIAVADTIDLTFTIAA